MLFEKHKYLLWLISLIVIVHSISFFIWFDDETVRFFVLPRPHINNFPEFLYNNWIELYENRNAKWVKIELASKTYRPLMTLTFLIDRFLWGKWYPGYHIFNFLGHIIFTYLIFKFIYLIFRKIDIAIISASLFAIHPLTTQPMWILGDRAEVYNAIFYILATYFLVKFYNSKKKKFYFYSICISIVPYLIKEMAITLPFFILFTLIYLEFHHRKLGYKKAFLISIPYFLILIFYFIFRISIFKGIGGYNTQSFLNFEWLILDYAKFFQWFCCYSSDSLIVSFLIILVLIILAIIKIKRIPELFYGLGWIFIVLVPVSNLCQKWYLYLPLAGFTLIVASIINLLKNFKLKLFIYRALIIILAFLSLVELRKVLLRTETSMKIAREIKRFFPDIKGYAIIKIVLPERIEMEDLGGYFFNPKNFIVKKNPHPLKNIVWDLNRTRYYKEKPIFSKLVQSMVRLLYNNPYIEVKLIERKEANRLSRKNEYYLYYDRNFKLSR